MRETMGSQVNIQENGQALAEYSLILAFIAIVCVAATAFLGAAIAAGFGSILPAF